MMPNPIDLTIGILVIVLGLKGALSGFRRELFGFLGLIGGVFIASRSADPLARLVEEHLFRLANPAFLRLIAFILVLGLIWGGISMLNRLMDSRFRENTPSPLSRLGGFLVAAVKYFLVFAMILAALYQTPRIRNSLHRSAKSSLLFPWLIPTGKTLINLPPSVGHSSRKA